jgi:outer membrane protein TolC
MHLIQDQDPVTSIPELSIKLQELEEKYNYYGDQIPTTLDFLCHIERLENARKLTLFSDREVQEYLDLALSLRPDLLAKKLQIGVAQQNVREKLGTYLPQVSGYARYSYNDNTLGTVPFFEESYHWAVGSWNLFDSLLRESEIREAKSLKSATQIQYDLGYQKVEVEIRNGLYQLEEALLAYLSSSQAVFVAEQARDQAQDKLTFGKIAPLEYRDSVNQLAQAQNLQNRSKFDLLAAYYQIRYSTGRDASTTGR